MIRVLRIWDLYRPIQQSSFDTLDARPEWVTQMGMYYFYALAPFAVAGAIFLRRRRLLLFPLVSLVITATVAAALFYANGRYRTEGDLGVAILGAIGNTQALILAPAGVRPRSNQPLPARIPVGPARRPTGRAAARHPPWPAGARCRHSAP